MPLKFKHLLWFLPGTLLMSLSTFSTLHISPTSSLPYWVFFSLKGGDSSSLPSLQRGEYVSFWNPWSKKTLAKQVMGLPGDVITIKNGHVFITQDLGPLQKRTQSGLSLTSIQAGTIPEGKVYVRGTDDHSVDSRYQEVGLIDMSSLKLIRPLL